MKTVSTAVFFACIFAAAANAQTVVVPATSPGVQGIAFEPMNPVAGQEVGIVIDVPSCGWRYEAARNGSLIAIEQVAYPALCPGAVPINRVRFNMGPLPAGEYVVKLNISAGVSFPPALSGMDESILIVATASVLPGANYTGMWNDPNAPGWGIGFLQSSSGQAFATIYAHDAAGNPFWHGVPGGVWTTPTRFEGTILTTRTTGGPVTTPYRTVGATGRMVIQFDAQGGARLSYVLFAKPPLGTALPAGIPIRYEESRNLRKLAF